MKILFLTDSNPDNLQDAYLHGLRSIYEKKWFAFSKMDKSSVDSILNSILELK